MSSDLPGIYLYAYRSSSELGIWRLAYLRDGDCGLFKGKLDYVQGTSIHIDLMRFIEENWSDICEASSFIPALRPHERKPCHAEHSSDSLKLCLVPPFITHLESQMIDNEERRYKGTPGVLSTTPNIFRQHLKITCANDNNDSISKIWASLMDFGQILDEKYTLQEEDIKHSHDYVFKDTFAGIRADVKIGRATLRPRVEGDETYVLIYLIYEAKYKEKIVGGCNGIALLTSKGFAITKYGIYTQYVEAGMFICKPFFYTSMCSSSDKNISGLLCKTTYIWVGIAFQAHPFSTIYAFETGTDKFLHVGDHLKTAISGIKDAAYKMITASGTKSTKSVDSGLSLSALNKYYTGNLSALGEIANKLRRTLTIGEELNSPQETCAKLCRKVSIEDAVVPFDGANDFDVRGVDALVGTKRKGGNKSHKKRKTQRKKTKRKTQKRRSYSIFRSNK